MTNGGDFQTILRLLIPGYLAARRDDCQLLEQAIAAHDHRAIQDLGHRLAGSGASYGFPAISAAGARLETAGERRDLTAAASAADALAAAVEQALDGG